MSEKPHELTEIKGLDDIRHEDGHTVKVCGVYQAIEMPTKRPAPPEAPRNYAKVLLPDGVGVHLGAYNTPEAERPDEELARFDGRTVCVFGTIHAIMPSTGQAPRKPCICNIERIVPGT